MKSQISKVLFALKGSNWIQKRTSIEEGADYKTMPIEGLMGKLIAFEETQKHIDEEDFVLNRLRLIVEVKEGETGQSRRAWHSKLSWMQMMIALAMKKNDDEAIALLTKNFNKFLKFNKRKTGSPFGKQEVLQGKGKMTLFQDVSDAIQRST